MILAILLIWISTKFMVKTKKVFPFLPFFVAGVLFILSGSFGFYAIFDQKAWFLIEILWPPLILGIITILWGKQNDK